MPPWLWRWTPAFATARPAKVATLGALYDDLQVLAENLGALTSPFPPPCALAQAAWLAIDPVSRA